MTENLKNRTIRLLLVYLSLVVINMGYGGYGPLLKRFAQEHEVNPLVYCFYRGLGGSLVIFLEAYASYGVLEVPGFRDGIIFSIVGIICFYGANVSGLPAVYYTSADTGSILMQVTPLCTYFLVVIMKMESIPNLSEVNGFLKIAGIFFASSGAVIVILGAQSNTGFMTRNERTGLQIFGFVSIFAHILCHSLSVVVQKKYVFSDPESKWKSRPLYVTAWAMLCCTCFAGAVCLAYVGKSKTFMNPITGTALVPLFYSILITTGVSYTLTTWCTSQIESSIVSATWPLTAMFCIVFSFFLTGEVLNTTQIMGCLIIFLAEGMVAWGNYLKENLDDDYKK